MGNKNKQTSPYRLRSFDMFRPLLYNGQYYPTTQMAIDDGEGNIQDTTVFADRAGNYFTQGANGMAIPVMRSYDLPEVTVLPSQEDTAHAFDNYLTMSNDNTKVNNTAHREYNPQLNNRTIQGAKSNALWEKEHPNLSSWGYAASAIPFAVAAAPAMMAGGDALAGSTLGQAATNITGPLVNAAMQSKWFPWVDAAVTSYFGAEGMNDALNGKFTPETAMELAPLLQLYKPAANVTKSGINYAKNWRPWVPETEGRYYRIVGNEGGPIEDAIESGVIRGPGANPNARQAMTTAQTKNKLSLRPKAFGYPMFSKDKLWTGSTSRVSHDSKPYVIRSKADTGPIVWEESNKDFSHKGHAGIFRPSYYGDINASPTKYFEYFEPKKIGYLRKDFPYEEPSFKSELDWAPDSWFGTRVTGKYDAEDVAALATHVPEYKEIERVTKNNGTWLKMPDGTTWEGDPRSWVQMMSKNYNNYTSNSPFKYQAFSHSSPHKFDSFDYSHFGETDDGFYGRGFYTHPAENIDGKLVGRNSYGDVTYLLTTNVQKPFDLNNPNFEYAGAFNWPNTNAPKGIFDGYDSVYYGIPGNKTVGSSPSELVVTKPNNYKSLLGNNGNFDPLNSNMYKGLIPLGITTYTLNQLPQNK